MILRDTKDFKFYLIWNIHIHFAPTEYNLIFLLGNSFYFFLNRLFSLVLSSQLTPSGTYRDFPHTACPHYAQPSIINITLQNGTFL